MEEKNKKLVLNQECHSRCCRPQDSGIPTAFNNTQGGDPRLQASGMTALLNDIPLIRPAATFPLQGGRKHTLGFTLIELLVVVLIVGILAAVALPQYQKAVTKARLFALVQTANSLADAEEVFYMEHGYYTDDRELLDFSVPQRFNKNQFIASVRPDGTIGSVTAVEEWVGMGYVYYFKHNSLSSYANRAECQLATDSPPYKHALCQELLHTNANFINGTRTIYYKGSFR